MIRTVQGDIPRDRLGMTLVHEHLLNREPADLVGDDDANLDESGVIAPELAAAVSAGLHTLVEVSTSEMSRDLAGILEIVRPLGLNLVGEHGLFLWGLRAGGRAAGKC